jgi:hypothetical protein
MITPLLCLEILNVYGVYFHFICKFALLFLAL